MTRWNRNGLPPSDPYKRYLVVYCPWDYNNNQHDAFHIRFDIASYFTGEGTYEKRPWHLTVTQSVTEKEIIAWADIGDAEDFKHYLHREPKPCCGKDYWHGNVFKYCPSCGAIMKGGGE